MTYSPHCTNDMNHFAEQQPCNEEPQPLPKLQHQRVGNKTPQHRMDSSSPTLQHQRVGNYTLQHRMDSTNRLQQDCSIPVQDGNREVNHLTSTSHGGWTELDMYQRQREEYIDGLC